MGLKEKLEERKEEKILLKADKADEKFMREALKQAEKARKKGEVPIGCVVVRKGKVISRGHNRRNKDRSSLAHAEIFAIRGACKRVKDWRLTDCTLYVTLEPCPMCAGAIVQARIPRVVIGAMNPKAGCAGSAIDLLNMPSFDHQCEVRTGVLGEECSTALSSFFRRVREENKDYIGDQAPKE